MKQRFLTYFSRFLLLSSFFIAYGQATETNEKNKRTFDEAQFQSSPTDITQPSKIRHVENNGDKPNSEQSTQTPLELSIAKNYLLKNDYKSAIELLKKAADLYDNAEAQNLLGLAYLRILKDPEYKSLAHHYFEQAAAQNCLEALLNLGYMYAYGTGVDKDPVKAMEFFKKAADQGEPKGQIELAIICRDGKGVKKNIPLAIELASKALNQDQLEALSTLGKIYFYENNYDLALKYFSQGCDLHQRESAYHLGLMYLEGKGVKKDVDLAVNYLEKDAKKGLNDAQFELGKLYLTGTDIEKDLEKAFQYFVNCLNSKRQHILDYLQKKVVEGSLDHHYVLSRFQFRFNLWDDYLQSLTKLSNDDYTSAQERLGIEYYNGEHISKDNTKAAELLTKPAKQGYPIAQCILGKIFLPQDGEDNKNMTKAIKWLTKSEDLGCSEAQYILGVLHLEDRHIQKNHSEGLDLLTKAANQNHTKALDYLGSYYYKMKDYKLAVEWLKKSAKNKNANSQFDLGVIYYQGYKNGYPNYDKAFKWFFASALKNLKPSVTVIQNIFKEIPISLNESEEYRNDVLSEIDNLSNLTQEVMGILEIEEKLHNTDSYANITGKEKRLAIPQLYKHFKRCRTCLSTIHSILIHLTNHKALMKGFLIYSLNFESTNAAVEMRFQLNQKETRFMHLINLTSTQISQQKKTSFFSFEDPKNIKYSKKISVLHNPKSSENEKLKKSIIYLKTLYESLKPSSNDEQVLIERIIDALSMILDIKTKFLEILDYSNDMRNLIFKENKEFWKIFNPFTSE